MITYELQRSRLSNYKFDLEEVLQNVRAKGKCFQYTHSRLMSLEERNPMPGSIEFNSKFLDEIEAIDLALEIAKFPEALLRAKIELGPHILVNYMFSLNSKISKTLSKLNVLNENNLERKAQRILLFRTARETLAYSMRLIGIKPLDKM